ncbi:hypothetical protein KM043_016829 [Ampulex compressa]|nr:hypothetical protein KM043_016829 [Ampulex compressa]
MRQRGGTSFIGELCAVLARCIRRPALWSGREEEEEEEVEKENRGKERTGKEKEERREEREEDGDKAVRREENEEEERSEEREEDEESEVQRGKERSARCTRVIIIGVEVRLPATFERYHERLVTSGSEKS